MAHPFEKMFVKALAKSHGDQNHVLGEAERLRELGYSPNEIFDVLTKFARGLIIESDEKVVQEALEEFSQYLS